MLPHFCLPYLPGVLTFAAGTRDDYRALERFHYVPGRPATFAAVLSARWTPDGGAGGTAGDGGSMLVGVAVLSHPSALNRTRHRVFGIKGLPFGQRLRWVNAHLRTVSRVIVHPQFRGLGVSGQMIARLRQACPTPYLEASARMGRAHPLFDRAGFARVEPQTPREPLYFWCATGTPPAPPPPVSH